MNNNIIQNNSNTFKVTKITTNSKCAKQYVLKNGTLIKHEHSTGIISKASAETIHLNSLHDLKTILDKALPSEMLILGHNKHTDIPFKIVTKQFEDKKQTFARTLENFQFDNSPIVLMDFDDLPKGMTIEDALKEFSDYYPSFAKAGKLICKSSSGSIKELDKNNYHVFVQLKDKAHADLVFKQWIKHRSENNLPLLIDQALSSSQQNRVVFLKPVVPNGYTIDKECKVIEGGLWDPSDEIVYQVFNEPQFTKVTVEPVSKITNLRDCNHKLLIERFDLWADVDYIRDLAIKVGCRPSRNRELLFTPYQEHDTPKAKIISERKPYFISAIGKDLHGKKGYNAFPLLVKYFEVIGKLDPKTAYINALQEAFGLIEGNDVDENAKAFELEKLLSDLPKVVGNSDEGFKKIEGFDDAKDLIKKGLSVFIKSVHGSGKTQEIVKSALVDMVKDSGKKMVYIAPTISLCEQAAHEIAETGVKVASYSDDKAFKSKYKGVQIVITTPNSFIEKVIEEGFIPSIIVVDEWVRVAASLAQRDSEDPFMGVFQRKAIIDQLKITEQLVLLDADDSYVSVELANYIGVKHFVNNTFKNKEHIQPEYEIRDAKDWASLFDLAIGYRKGFIFTDSKRATNELSAGLISKGFNVLTVNADTTDLLHVKKFLANPNEEVHNYDYIIYSPSMNVGTSITSVEWPTLGLIKGVVSPYDVLQGLRRSRRVGVVDGAIVPVTVFFNEHKYNKDSKTGAATQKSVDAYNNKLKKLSETLFKSSDDSSDVLSHLEEYSSIFSITYNQKPKDAFVKLLEHRGEVHKVLENEVRTEGKNGLNRSVAKSLDIEKASVELANAKPKYPSDIYHNPSARKAMERESGIKIITDEAFVAERKRDAMEILLNIEEGFLDSVDNTKMALEEGWMSKAIAYNTLVDNHPRLFEVMCELGNGKKKAGDFVKELMTILREYCWIEGGVFSDIPLSHRLEVRKILTGNYLTSFGYEFGMRAGKENLDDFEKASGQVLRRFLGNVGIEVVVSRRRENGKQCEFSGLSVKHFIIDRSIKQVEQQETETMTLAREILKQFKVE